MSGFNIGLSGEIGREHGEIVGDDSVEIVILPIRSDLCFVRHLCCGLPRNRLTAFNAAVVSFNSHSHTSAWHSALPAPTRHLCCRIVDDVVVRSADCRSAVSRPSEMGSQMPTNQHARGSHPT